MTDKTQSRGELGCLRHRFQRSLFLSVQTKTQLRSFETKMGTAALSNVSLLGARKKSSVNARHESSKSYAF